MQDPALQGVGFAPQGAVNGVEDPFSLPEGPDSGQAIKTGSRAESAAAAESGFADNKLLFGFDPTERIVAVEFAPPNIAVVFLRQPDGTTKATLRRALRRSLFWRPSTTPASQSHWCAIRPGCFATLPTRALRW